MQLKEVRFLFVLLVAGSFLCACEGPKYYSITVVDKTTHMPLDSVFIKVKVFAGDAEKSAYNLQGYSDSKGNFIRDEMIGYGIGIRRWDFFMEYSKPGYESITEKNKTEGVVELQPSR